jgi:hypothetical protein
LYAIFFQKRQITRPPDLTIDGLGSVTYDLQNTPMTAWCGYANAGKLFPYIDFEIRLEHMSGGKKLVHAVDADPAVG